MSMLAGKGLEAPGPARAVTRKVTYRPEMFTFALLIVVILASILMSASFRDVNYILRAATRSMEYGILALMMSYIIISGLIDLSVASSMACVSTLTGLLYHELQLPMLLAILIGLAFGFVLGLFNGLLVAYADLPPLIVTIGTMALYRGIPQIFIGDRSLSKFPAWFNAIDKIELFKIGETPVYLTLVIFILIAAVFHIVLKYTVIGRRIYGLGTNEVASHFSGVSIKRLKLFLFAFSGFFAGLAGLMTMSRLQVVRFDMATGGELEIITIALLGGIDMEGGRGNILGTFMAVLIVTILKTGLTVAKVKAQDQMFVMGAILIISIVVPKLVKSLSRQGSN
jgi:rhamnose transport system permease protein